VGLFRRKDERAIPEPGSKEFEEAVEGSALPDDGSVSMDEPGWSTPEEPATEPEERAEAADAVTEPEQSGEDSGERPRRQRVLGALGRSVLKPPNADGFGGGVKKR
jgi:hypothetical protein